MKKGVSPIIAWVLLVGMAVSIGTMVSIYLINQAKEFNPGAGQELELYCADVAVDAKGLCYEGNNLKLRVTNRGKFTIYKVNPTIESNLDFYQGDRINNRDIIETGIPPSDEDDLLIPNPINLVANPEEIIQEISLNPEIKIEGQKVVCNQKIFKLKIEGTIENCQQSQT